MVAFSQLLSLFFFKKKKPCPLIPSGQRIGNVTRAIAKNLATFGYSIKSVVILGDTLSQMIRYSTFE